VRGPIGLASLALLLVASPSATAQATPGAGSQSTTPREKKPARTFTDDDLARYREERLRESAPAEAASPRPAAAPAPAVPGGAHPTPLPSASVELLDLNRTLPPDLRTSAEATGRQFLTFFHATPDGPLVIPLRYFPDWNAYREYLARNYPFPVDWTGYYDPRKREIVVGRRSDTQAVLVHEINHFVFDTVFDEAPAWLREGLAEYFEASTPTPDGLSVADQPRHRRQLALWLQGSRQPDLRQLLALTGSTWRDHELAGSQLVRALSWSVVDFLMSSPGGQKTLRQFLDTLKDQRGLHSLEAFNRTFPGGSAAFERQWLEYVERRSKAQ
jgi:hypothetical protein